MSWDEIRTSIALVAVIVSFTSLYFARRSWQSANRPLVTAFIEANGEGVAFDLKVSNTGTRPALNVVLGADQAALDTLLEDNAQAHQKRAVYECFAPEASIPVLRNGETLSTALGAYEEDRPWLRYGAQTKIELKYSDLEGRKYRSTIPVKVFVREGFGGSVWRKTT